MRVYFWNVFPAFVLYPQNSILRFLNRNTLAMNITAILMPLLVVVFSGYLAFAMEMGPIGLIYGFALAKAVSVIIFFYVIYTADWEKSYNAFKMNTKKV